MKKEFKETYLRELNIYLSKLGYEDNYKIIASDVKDNGIETDCGDPDCKDPDCEYAYMKTSTIVEFEYYVSPRIEDPATHFIEYFEEVMGSLNFVQDLRNEIETLKKEVSSLEGCLLTFLKRKKD